MRPICVQLFSWAVVAAANLLTVAAVVGPPAAVTLFFISLVGLGSGLVAGIILGSTLHCGYGAALGAIVAGIEACEMFGYPKESVEHNAIVPLGFVGGIPGALFALALSQMTKRQIALYGGTTAVLLLAATFSIGWPRAAHWIVFAVISGVCTGAVVGIFTDRFSQCVFGGAILAAGGASHVFAHLKDHRQYHETVWFGVLGAIPGSLVAHTISRIAGRNSSH